MMVESNTRTSPSMSVGTSARGLASSELAVGLADRDMPSGTTVSNGRPLARSAILTFMAYADMRVFEELEHGGCEWQVRC